jgi:phage terminase large subunit-like protein
MIDLTATLRTWAGRICYGGLDLSSVRDFSSFSLVSDRPGAPGTIDVFCRIWCPNARLYADDNRYRDQYQAWERDGWLTVTEGDAIDYDLIEAQIVADAQIVRIDSLNIDRLFQGASMAQHLEAGGLEVYGMGQGFLSYAAPMKEFEKRLLDRQINHGGHPVLRFCADNVAVSQDPAGNLKPNKAESQGKIDGIVSTIMALDRYIRAGGVSGVDWAAGINI